MRILHVVASYLPATRYGGTIVSVHGLTRALAARGHDVHVFTTSVDGPDDSKVAHGEPVDVDGVKVWYFRSERLRRIYYSAPLGAGLRAQARTFDLIHTHAIFLWPLWAAARAARRSHVPYVVSPRGMLERDLIARRSPFAKALWIGAIERRNLEGAAAIHVTSAREADEARAFGFNLPAVVEIPNGVEFTPEAAAGGTSAAIANLLRRGPFVLFLGRLSWKKGLDRLVAAMASVRGADLVIAGNDEDGYRQVVEDLAARGGVSGRIVFTGAVSGADKAALLLHARLLVLPSYSENFGNVVLEAMSAACPVIVTPEVGVAPVVEAAGAGWVVDGDPAALGSAITRLVESPDLRAQMANRGRVTARDKFSWAAVAERMERAYQSITNGSHAG